MLKIHGRIALLAALIAAAALHYGYSALSLLLALATLIYLCTLLPLQRQRPPAEVPDPKSPAPTMAEANWQDADVKPWTEVIQSRRKPQPQK